MVELDLEIDFSCGAKREGSFDWTKSDDKSERDAEAEPLRGPAYDARRGDAGTSTRGTLDMGPRPGLLTGGTEKPPPTLGLSG